MTEPVYVYRGEVLEVHDGDTYTVRVDLGFKCAVEIQCRLFGVDAPELPTKAKPDLAGLAARDFVRALPGPGIVIRSHKDQRSFERWVCEVWLSDGRSLADVLVEAGHAVRL